MAQLQDLISSDGPIRLIAHVSNGPWYGFNGVQALVLTKHCLYRIQASQLALLPGALLNTFALSDISNAQWRPQTSGNTGRLSFRTGGRRKSYASKWAEAADLAAALPND